MYKGFKVIDVHGHQTTPPEFSQFALSLLRLRNMGKRDNPVFELSDEKLDEALQRHLRMMDERNIDIQMISPRPVDMWHWEVPAIQSVWCRVVNDVTHQTCRLHPDRFVGIAQLPQDVESTTANCVAELERCVQELGFVGAIVNPDPGADAKAPGMADEYWYPLYESAERLQATLMVHASISRDRRIEMVPHAYQINNCVAQFIATLSLEHSRVFKDFPKLKVFVCHFGGALNRFATEDTVHRYGTVDLPDNLLFDCCAYNAEFLALGIKQKGPHRVLFGSECPGSGSGTIISETGRPSDDLVPVLGELEFLTEENVIDIVHNNAIRSFPLFSG